MVSGTDTEGNHPLDPLSAAEVEAAREVWSARDRGIRDEDVVVWYNLRQTHVPAPEDWPILPAKRLSFVLEPVHSFEESPATDVPPEHAIKDVERWSTENQESLFEGE